jgi:putative PEP-CTERM system TPR-repeat lipoprotein
LGRLPPAPTVDTLTQNRGIKALHPQNDRWAPLLRVANPPRAIVTAIRCGALRGATAVALVLLLATSTLAATTADPSRAPGYLEEADAALGKDDLATALIHLKNAVFNDPSNPKARFELGFVLLQTGDFLAAETQLRAAAKSGYDRNEVAPYLAQTLLRLDQNQKLLDEIRAGDRPAPFEAMVRAARGYALLNIDRVAEGKESFRQALELNPTVVAKVGLARAIAASGDMPAAVAMVEAALAEDAKFADGWMLLGQLHRLLGDLAAAKGDFDKAMALRPRDASIRLTRTELLVLVGELDVAEAEVAGIIKASSAAPGEATRGVLFAHYLQAQIHSRRRNYRAAEVSLQNMKDGINRFPQAMYLLAAVAFAQDHLAQAEDAVNRYLVRVPNDEIGTALLATLLVRRNNLPRAIEVLKTAVEANPKSVRLLALLSDAYLQANQPEAAAAIIDRTERMAPDDVALRMRLAAQRLRIGQPNEALSDLEAATGLAPQSPQVGLLLILTYMQAQKVEAALAAAEAMRNRLPDNPLAETLIGAIMRQKGDLAEARAHFERALAIDPNFTSAQINLARALAATQDLAGARRLLDAVVQREPDNLDGLMASADLSLAEDKPNDAVLWLEKARAANAAAIEPRLRLVELFIARGTPEKAAAAEGELVKLAANDPRIVNATGELRLAGKDYPGASAAFERLVELAPGVARAQLQLARAYRAGGNDDKAHTAFERAIELAPNDLPLQQQFIRFAVETGTLARELAFARGLATEGRANPAYDLLIGNLLIAADQLGDAEATLKAGLAKRENNPALVLRLAQLQGQMAGPAKAAETLSGWLTKFPDAVPVRVALAGRLLQLKRNDEAIAAYEAVLKAEPDNLAAGNNLAWLYQTRKDARALPLAEALHRRAPRDPNISDTLGWILLQNGESGQALALLESIAAVPTAPLDARYHLALALKSQGRLEEARRTLEALLREGKPFDGMAESKALMKELAGG